MVEYVPLNKYLLFTNQNAEMTTFVFPVREDTTSSSDSDTILHNNPDKKAVPSINSLIHADYSHKAAVSNAIAASEDVIQLVVYYNIIHRLQGSLQQFCLSSAEKSLLEPNKFSASYQQAMDLCSSVLNNDYPRKAQGFASVLSSAHRRLLGDFLHLVKSPTYIASALSQCSSFTSGSPTLGSNNLSGTSFASTNSYLSPDLNWSPRVVSGDPYDDLVGLNRSKPLDILFFSLFTGDDSDITRAHYFATICASLDESSPSSLSKNDSICIDIFDLFMSSSGCPYAASFEILLLGILQDGAQFANESAFSTNTASRASTTNTNYKKKKNRNNSNNNTATALEAEHTQFILDCTEKVLKFLYDPAVEAIPKGFLDFIRLYLYKVASHNRKRALDAVVKYIFNRHLYRLLITPEHIGILKSCFVNDAQRKCILAPIFQRLQVQSSEPGQPLEELFLGSVAGASDPAADVAAAPKATFTTQTSDQPRHMIVLSPSDIISLYSLTSGQVQMDMEPVIVELVKKYPYLQPNAARRRLPPHPMTEKWQVFRADDNQVDDITAESILERTKVHFIDREEMPGRMISIVKRAVERIVSDASSSPYPVTFETTSLTALLSDCLETSLAKGFYLDGHEFSNALLVIKNLGDNVDSQVLESISREKEQNLSRVQQQIKTCQNQSEPYKIHLCSAQERCQVIRTRINDLRTKIWYITEVRQTPLWNRAKEVARALTTGEYRSGPNSFNTSSSSSTATSNTLSSGYATSPTSDGQDMDKYYSGIKRNHSSSSLASSGMFSFKRFTTSKREYPPRQMMNTLSSSSQMDEMFSPKEFAGEFKLSDREALATKRWLHGQQIQNFCVGEERIHRFCCEVDDLVKRIMGDTLSSRRNQGHSLLSSSSLFRDLWKLIIEVEGVDRNSRLMHRTATFHERSYSMRQKSSPSLLDVFASMDIRSESPHDSGFESTSPSVSSQGHGHKHSLSQHTNVQNPNQSMNSGGGKASQHHYRASSTDASQHKNWDVVIDDTKRQELDSFVLDIQMRLTGMIYSDIGSQCWCHGSETDKWMDAPIVRASTQRKAEQRERLRQQLSVIINKHQDFNYNEAYHNILHRLSVNPSPIGKLNTLYALEMLVVSSLSSSFAGTPRSRMSETPTPVFSPGFGNASTAATGATGPAANSSNCNNSNTKYFDRKQTRSTPSTDTIAEELRRVFKACGPRTLFRDLQFIAAFVPPSVLDLTDVGKAFWDVCLAAMSMKEETLGILMDTSTEIFQYATGMMMTTDVDHTFLSQWSMEDVAWLWNIAAKEGDIVAQRELAIMQLSHPHLTPISLAPLTRMSETFDSTLLSNREADEKLDPVRMAVVKHWMEKAAKRGDNIAAEYLLQDQDQI